MLKNSTVYGVFYDMRIREMAESIEIRNSFIISSKLKLILLMLQKGSAVCTLLLYKIFDIIP